MQHDASAGYGPGADDRYAILAHELRAPLNVLGLSLEHLLTRIQAEPGDTPPRWMLDSLRRQRRSVKRVQRLLEALLEAWRMESGWLELRREWFDLRDLASEVLTWESDALLNAGCSCSFVAPSSVIGHWDRLRVHSALANLVGNAVKFGAGAPIAVSVSGDHQSAWVEVSDHGVGIANEDRERIFDRRGRASDDHRASGFGLGLWLVKSIALAHGGQVDLRSALGQGASFTLRLPRSQ
jgi:signal transduction histidine kinase